MTLAELKTLFRRYIRVVAGGPADKTRGVGMLAILDALATELKNIVVDAYTKVQANALLLLKADLVNGTVPESQLPARAIGGIDFRHRKGSNGGPITIGPGDYWHVSAEVTLNLTGLAVNEVFFLRISSFASNYFWTRLLATDGTLFGAYPQGTALLFRRTGTGPTDLAVVTVSSEYPSYANAFVPDALKAAVAAGSYTNNQLDTTPAGSVATMQFRDADYLYFCFLDEQITNGVLTYAWLRVARVGGAGGTVNALALTTGQMDEVIALTYTNGDAPLANSPAWSKPGQWFDALVGGSAYRYTCGRGNYLPGGAPSGTSPVWTRFAKN